MSRKSLFLNIVFLVFLAFSTLAWVWPTEEEDITSDFGPRHRKNKSWEFHPGVDIGVTEKEIYAAEDGEAWWRKDIYNTIIVEHGSKYGYKNSMYLHCKTVYVPEGRKYRKKVKRGDVIGISGNKGPEGTGWHLDFRFEGNKLHPLKYLPYENSADPTVVKGIIVYPIKKGDTVKGKVTVKVNVLTTKDKDLNKCELYIDDELLAKDGTISYDPKLNCIEATAFPKEIEGVGDDYFIFEWNTTDVENGEHTLKIKATDVGYKTGETTKKVYVKNKAPIVRRVCFETDGEVDCFGDFDKYPVENIPIDVNIISFIFSRPMKQDVTTEAIKSVNPSFPYTVSWSNDSILTLTLSEMLDYCKKYTITVSDILKDTSGVQLDGNGDGEPGKDFVFQFKVEKPPLWLTLSPRVDHFELKNPGEHQSKEGKITIDGSYLLKGITCKLSKTIFGDDDRLSFSCEEGPFTISVGGKQTAEFTVEAWNEGGIKVSVNAVSQSDKDEIYKRAVGEYSASLEKKKDHPDENLSPGISSYPTPITLDDDTLSNPDKVGIFIYGWTIGYAHILGKYGMPITPVFSDLTYWENPDTLLSDVVPLVVMGSGALSGFNSQEFKKDLEEYVVNGGNLLVFTQKYGLDFSVLPGDINGYGWNEDQSCFKNAAYLSQWHPVFAGQTKRVMDCSADGYISEYPGNAEVLLSRTKNTMPALLYYNYGAGTIIVSSLYTDWGYGHNQRSDAELSLIRDLTTWALNPDMDIPEFYRDSAVSVPVSIKYTANDTSLATTAIIKVYTPDRKLYDSIAVPISLHSGEETEWVWNKSSISSNLGLWVIDYALKDGIGNWIQGYNRGAVFARKVKVKLGNYALGDFQLWATSSKEEIIKGDTVSFEIGVKNNTSAPFTGKIIIGVHEAGKEGGVWWKVIDSIPDFTVPKDTVIYTSFETPFSFSSSVYFGIYESSDSNYSIALSNALRNCQKGVWVIQEPLPISLSKDKYQYVLGVDTVHYKVTVGNRLSDSCSPLVHIYTLLDSIKYDIRGDTVDIATGEVKTIEGEFFPIDYDTTIGKQQLCCELLFRDSIWNSASTNFELTYPSVKCSLAIPDSFQYGDTNLYSVTLSAPGSWLPAGKLLLSGVVYFDSLIIDYSTGSDTALVFDYQPDAWWIDKRVSNNKLGAQYEYSSQIVSKEKNLNFQFPIISDFRPEYTGYNSGFLRGDTAVFKAQVSLKGSLYGVPLVYSLWSDYLGSDTLRDTIILNPTPSRTITLKTYTELDIPADTLISYSYRMSYLNKEYLSSGNLQYFITPPEAVLNWPVNDTFSIGNTIPIRFSNSITSPSQVYIDSIVIYGNGARESFITPGEVTVPAEGYYTFPVTVPGLKKGQYRLKIYSRMVDGKGVNLNSFPEGCPIYIDGIEADMEVSTEKNYYGYGEDIPFYSLLENGECGWNGAESLKVARVSDSLGKFSIWDLADTVGVDTLGLIPGGGGLVLDSVYSLGSYAEFPISEDVEVPRLVDVDEWGNFWTMSYNYENGERSLVRWDKLGGNVLVEFEIPSSVGAVVDFIPIRGIIYVAASDSGRIYKLNSASGNVIEYIEPPGRRFLNLTSIAIKENDNIIAFEGGTGILWEFSASGDSVSTFSLPYGAEYSDYYDVEYKNGVIYLSAFWNIYIIEGTSIIDSIPYPGCSPFGRISVNEEGKIAASLPGYGAESCHGLALYSQDRQLEAIIYYCYLYDLVFHNNDIFSCGNWTVWYIDENGYGYGIPYSGIRIYREFGKDYGILKALEFPNTPRRYQLHSSETFDDPKSGSISYGFLGPNGPFPDEDNLLPLETMYGTDSIPPLYVTMEGNFQNSPVFYACSLNIKVMDAIDSLIVENNYPLSLSPFENVSFADTVKDTIPAGDYCVLGDAYSNWPQHITSDWKSFTVIGNNLTLLLNSDKEEGFAGDTFRINPLTINPLPLAEDSLRLLVKGYFNERETVYVDTTFMLSAQAADSFPFVIMPDEPLVVRAELILSSSDTIKREFYPLIKSNKLLSVSLNAPDMTDFQPFGVISKVYNHSFDDLSVEVKRMFFSDTLIDTVDIERGGFYTFVDSFETTEACTLEVTATTGGQTFTKKKFIDLGIKGNITLDSLYEVSPDSVRMSGIIHNDGVYTLEGNALFCLLEKGLSAHGLQLSANNPTTQPGIGTTEEDGNETVDGRRLTADMSGFRVDFRTTLSAQEIAISSVEQVGKDLTLSEFISSLVRAGIDTSFSAIYLSPGESDTIPIVFDKHNAGNYTLKGFLFAEPSQVLLDSTSSSVNVVGNNQIFVDSLFVSPNCDSNGAVLLTAVVDNQSYSFFVGNLTIGSLVSYHDSVIEVNANSKDTLMFLLEDPIDEGVYTFTATISEGGVPVSGKIQNLEFHPIYQFDSLPVGLEVATPDSGIINIPVSNIGNARGERNVRVDLADAISINEDAIIDPASSDTFTTDFLIPEDFPGGEYFADASIFKNLYPEVDTFFSVKVNGLIVRARDSLDKPVYNVNDTAKLSILVENKSFWSGDLLVALQYGELELDTSFVLGGMEKGVLNTTPNRDTLYLDSSGVYMFDPISSDSYDSVSINWDISLADSIDIQIRTDSLIGKGNWNSIEEDTVYPVRDWIQLKLENISQNNQWINSLNLSFKPTGSIILDSFPVQKETITLDVPVDSSEVKLGWGIYYPSGRSIVLDERYVYLADSMLTIFTDKGRYEIADTVHATLLKNFPDTNYIFNYRVYFSPTQEILDSFTLEEDTTSFSFVIPEWTRSGTYSIDYWVGEGTADGGPLTALQLTASELTAHSSQLSANPSATPPGIGITKNTKEDDKQTGDGRQQTGKLTADGGPQTALAKQWVLGKPGLSAFGDSTFISGEHLFDVNGITVYFKNARMDTNLYHEGEIAKIRTEISSDVDISANLTISSTGSVVSDMTLDLEKDIPNKFEFDYPITGCDRGMNELYLHLAKDSMSLAGVVIYFDVYVGDTLAPLISVLKEPENTYSSNRFYELIARIYDPDTNGTPFTDTLYYRIASGGGDYWQTLSAHSVRGDTNKYLIPSHPNGTHIQYHLIARDEFGNVARYPEEGENDFWVLSPLKPTWEILTYSSAPSAILQWNSPEELVYYHSGLYSDTINISQTEIATRFTSQCMPASLEKIGLDIINESAMPSSDTLGVFVYTVNNLLPGTKIDSFEFIDTIAGYEEFNLEGIDIPEEGIFVGIKGSSNLSAVLDGFGEGTHTVMRSGGLPWEYMTPGELLIDGLVSHTPSTKLRSPSDIFAFDVLRSTDLSNWTKITSGLTLTSYADTMIEENVEYSYKVMVSFGNPVDSFFSMSRTIFVDFTPPALDTISINKSGENLLIRATLRDTSGIAWDSLGYWNNDTINIISEDSSKNNEYFFSFDFAGDTLFYYLKAQDLSLIGNTRRYPETGFYKWWTLSGIAEAIPDSTYLCRMSNLLIERNIEIKYAISEKSDVGIMLFDITGRRVETLVNQNQNAGYYSVPMRASDLPFGVYFLRMQAGDYNKTIKLVKVR